MRWTWLLCVIGISSPASASSEAISGQRPANPVIVAVAATAAVDLGGKVFRADRAAVAALAAADPPPLRSLYNAGSCDACHPGGSAAGGPVRDGPVPPALEVQLESPSADPSGESSGDPVYGRVFNTAASGAAAAEGVVIVQYREVQGYYYPDGTRWHLRAPRYRLVGLSHGPLSPSTIIKPRLAPALFGVGLLDAIPDAAISGVAAPGTAEDPHTFAGQPAWQLRRGVRVLGRLGWQARATSIRDQAAKAFALEMGLTSRDRVDDDCTRAEPECRSPQHDRRPEVSEDLLEAVVGYVRTLPVAAAAAAREDSFASTLFRKIGCSACHRPHLPVARAADNGRPSTTVITPYTDLRLHDLGMPMADENAAGVKVVTKWRTAPLWGLAYRLRTQRQPTLLHDGRARSVEEAILWHGGEAAPARREFGSLGPRSRAALLDWVEAR